VRGVVIDKTVFWLKVVRVILWKKMLVIVIVILILVVVIWVMTEMVIGAQYY
jgi:hypothetical protein